MEYCSSENLWIYGKSMALFMLLWVLVLMGAYDILVHNLTYYSMCAWLFMKTYCFVSSKTDVESFTFYILKAISIIYNNYYTLTIPSMNTTLLVINKFPRH